jgi:hypothetical protein
MTSRLTTRLANLEKRRRPPDKMRGSIEVHCLGGWQKVDGGLECHEHERCAFHSTPVSGRLRRVVMFDWQEGMGNPFEIG